MSADARARRILIVNPNTSAHITALMLREAERLVPPDVAVEAVTAPFGPASLECEAELAIAAHAVLAALATHAGAADAAIIGAFGDPGLEAAADLMPLPVVGLGRAGMQAAGKGGRRFAIVTVGTGMKAAISRAAARAGVTEGLGGIAFLGARVLDLAQGGAAFHDEIAVRARDCVTEFGAEAILLAGAPFSGMARQLTPRLPVPVLDGLTSALEAALAAGPRTVEEAHHDEPDKAIPGVAPDLARLIAARLRAG